MTPSDLETYWQQPDRLHTDNQIRLINKAQFKYWSIGEPIPVDLYMEMTEAGLNPEQLKTHHFEN